MPTNITPYNKVGKRHGYWETYFDNGRLDYKGEFINEMKNGLHESYWPSGRLLSKGFYDLGKRIGYWIKDGKKLFYVN